MKTPYNHEKCLVHTDHINNIALMRKNTGKILPPITIQLLPFNSCNHRCFYCSYQHWRSNKTQGKLWRNTELYKSTDFIPWAKMQEMIRDFKEMGVKGILLLGGGEPLLYPHINSLLDLLVENSFDLALITNGTRMNNYQANLIANNMVGIRISLDAGTPETYSQIKQVSKTEWYRAINSIKKLSKFKKNGELNISVGYVLNKLNYNEIIQAAQIVKELGANSIRISAAFTPSGLSYFSESDLVEARRQAYLASVSLNGHGFQVINQIEDKLDRLKKKKQDYSFCSQQSMSIVVGADQAVYTCCMLAYNRKGLMGSLKETDFLDLWKNSFDFRSKFRPDIICNNECNYEQRNKLIISVLNQSDKVGKLNDNVTFLHHNII